MIEIPWANLMSQYYSLDSKFIQLCISDKEIKIEWQLFLTRKWKVNDGIEANLFESLYIFGKKMES